MVSDKFDEKLKALVYPSSYVQQDIWDRVFAGIDEFVGTKAQIEAREKELAEQAKIEVKKAKEAYAEQHQAILDEFKGELIETCGMNWKPVDEAVYAEAWEHGSHGGVSLVEQWYVKFAKIAAIGFQEGEMAARNESRA